MIEKSRVPGYWMYELSDLAGKGVIDFEGSLVDPEAKYIEELRKMNGKLGGKSVTDERKLTFKKHRMYIRCSDLGLEVVFV